MQIEPPQLDSAAEAFVAEAINSGAVVMFALEWCEFCWSARNLLNEMGIEYKSVDLDSVPYQAGEKGNKIRAVLAEQTGSPTIPQIYVGGKHIGGCTELFDYQKSGALSRDMIDMGIAHQPFEQDPYSLLPKWLHSRAS